ncbi:sag-related sequence srs17a [Cystoisospora suis]|uniref:Sag-related sequence srs17a n=1 Tax=Cystoisospora suis TaxID=483139 RepID=A0A2C6KPZ1_9APIC|nr:sag-related sequence srs17a [Cystoisospora suis]
MVLKQCTRFAVLVVLALPAGSLKGVLASSPDGLDESAPLVLDIDPYKLPSAAVADLPMDDRVPQPEVCEYPTGGEKEGVLRLTAEPGKHLAFRCPGGQDELTPSDNSIFTVKSDGSCDTSKGFRFPEVNIAGYAETVPKSGSTPAYTLFFSAALSYPFEKQFCYVCKAAAVQGQRDAAKKCTVFITVPKKDVTNVTTCTAGDALAAIKDDASELTSTFTCGGGQDIIPPLGTQQARTGDGCRWLAPLSRIVNGASLESTTVAGSSPDLKSYKLRLASLPEKPRLFCFLCEPQPQLGGRGRPCRVHVYVPALVKKPGDPGRNSDRTDLVVSTTTVKPSPGHSESFRLTWLLSVSALSVSLGVASLFFL